MVTRQRLDDQKLTNLTEVLEATPGITVLRTGIGAENDTYWSRGFQINNFEIDGVPTSRAWTTPPRARRCTTVSKSCVAPPA